MNECPSFLQMQASSSLGALTCHHKKRHLWARTSLMEILDQNDRKMRQNPCNVFQVAWFNTFFFNDEVKELEKESFLTNDAISGDFVTPSLGPGSWLILAVPMRECTQTMGFVLRETRACLFESCSPLCYLQGTSRYHCG